MSDSGDLYQLSEYPGGQRPVTVTGPVVAVSHPSRPGSSWPRRLWRAVEALLLLAAPLLVFVVLHERAMAPVDMVDPALHTAFIVHPHDLLTGHTQLSTRLSRDREGARVGFLLPARAAYLLFGAVPGFFVTRYFFALIAIVPLYLLLRRVRGPAAGAIGVLVVLSSPVVVTTWGTDYPDSAAISYLIGGLACLAMPGAARRPSRWDRSGWVIAAGALFTLAVWSQLIAAALVGPAVIAAMVVRLWRDRSSVLRDLGLLLATAVVVTGALMPLSAAAIGRADFITPTLNTLRTYSRPVMVARYHSRSWVWAPYLAYLLVPPAVLGAWLVCVATQRRRAPTPIVVLGLAAAGQLGAYAYLQFDGNVETLEYHYFSSMLWGSVLPALAAVLTVVAAPLLARRVARWIPAAVLVAVPLIYEHSDRPPAFGWHQAGLDLAAVAIGATAVAAAVTLTVDHLGHGRAAFLSSTALIGVITPVLLLTTAPIPAHRLLPGTATQGYPRAAYRAALGNSGSYLVDGYRVAAELPAFVGPAAYPGEQLVQWWPAKEQRRLYRVVGLYHAWANSAPRLMPEISASGRAALEARRPQQVLLLGLTTDTFPMAVLNLEPYGGTVVRTTTLRSGRFAIHAWLLDLDAFRGQNSALRARSGR